MPTSQGTNTHQLDFVLKKSKREGVGTKPSDTNVNTLVSALMCVCMHDAVDGRICLNIYDEIFTVNVNTCCTCSVPWSDSYILRTGTNSFFKQDLIKSTGILHFPIIAMSNLHHRSFRPYLGLPSEGTPSRIFLSLAALHPAWSL